MVSPVCCAGACRGAKQPWRDDAEGKGVVQDYVRAHMWLNLSAASGYSRAVESRDTVAKLMTPQQIAEAQKLARECQARQFKGCN